MHRSPAWAAAPLALALLLVACAAPRTAPTRDAPARPDPTPALSIPMGPDGPEVPEDVVAKLQAYAAKHAGDFGGLYMHPPGSGSFVVLFTDRLEEHAAALAEISPRVTVRHARYTEAELLAVMERLDLSRLAGPGVEPLSASLDTMNNRVTLEVKSDDPTLEARLELEYGGMVDVTVHPLPGAWANVESGAGWRLLASAESGPDEAYTVRAATDGDGWDAMWSALGLAVARPEVDLDEEIVVSFAHGIGSSCREVRLDGVEIGGGVVYSVTSGPLAPRACTSDLTGSAVLVVAIERGALPWDSVTVQLHEQRRTGPDSGFQEIIDVPLP